MQGSAYAFVRSGTTWTQQTQLVANNGAANDQFGFSVALDGNTALVGAPTDDVGANQAQGTAYVFVRNGSFWTQEQQLISGNGSESDTFGNSVALGGGTALVGSPLSEVGTKQAQGSVYVYAGGPTAVVATAVSAHRTGRTVVVRWRSADPSVLGYRVYREQTGRRVLLTPRLLGARPSGAYRYIERNAPRGPLRYRLQAVRTDGTTVWAGFSNVARRQGARR